MLGPVDPWAAPPPRGACNAGAGNASSYAPAHFARFALFSPQFGRRPFVRERNGRGGRGRRRPIAPHPTLSLLWGVAIGG